MPLHFPAQGDSSKCQESCSMWLLESHQFALYLLLSLRWAALYDRERLRANPHARGEAHLVTSYRPQGVSNTETVLSLVLSPRRPRLRRGLLPQCRMACYPGSPSVPRVSKTSSPLGGGGSFPLWSFLLIGIGEHPASNSLAFGDLISLHSLSYPWVSGR